MAEPIENEVDVEDVFKDPSEEEKTEEEESENQEDTEDDDDPKDRRSEIVQKKRWREKAQSASKKVLQLTEDLEKLKEAMKKPSDEKEAAAQKYIRDQAKAVFDELQAEKTKEEAKELADFEDKVQTLLEDHPEITEEELLDAIEDYEVEPATALKILQKQSSKEKETGKKPKMPQPKRASSSSNDEKRPDDSKKSLFQIASEEIFKAKNK